MATADELTSELNIKIIGVALAADNVPMTVMMLDVVRRAAGYGAAAKNVTIRVNEPEKDGSLHYDMHVEYTSGGGIHVGAIRRTFGAPTEFHS